MDYKIFLNDLKDACMRWGGRVIITGHDQPDADSVLSAVMLNRLLAKLGIETAVKFPTAPDNVTLRDMKALGVWQEEYLSCLEAGDGLVLVDHHATFHKNMVIGCVDHHTTPPAPVFKNALVVRASSCGKIIYDMAVECALDDVWMKKMALYSIYLDTQSCRSTKFNCEDAPWVRKTLEEFEMDEKELERMGFCLNSFDEDVKTLAMYGYKRYEFKGKRSASTCIQIDTSEKEWGETIPKIVEYLKLQMVCEGCEMWAFVLNMPIESRSDIYYLRENGVEILRLDRLASRSKDVIPIANSL